MKYTFKQNLMMPTPKSILTDQTPETILHQTAESIYYHCFNESSEEQDSAHWATKAMETSTGFCLDPSVSPPEIRTNT